jgi:uncharacterized membrane protein (GlpM family)
MSSVVLIRWSARILSGLIVLFFGFFLVAHLIGDQGRPTRAVAWGDYVILATLVASLVGLLLAWKWEFAGAAVTLVAILVCAIVNWRILVSPGALILISSLLYLISWWISGASRNHSHTKSAPV